MKRYGSIITIKPGNLKKYIELHEAVWPEHVEMLRNCNIRNFSIFHKNINGIDYLFSYYEYFGKNHEADMARLAADPKTKEWWTHTDPLQAPIKEAKMGEWWSLMREVMHLD